MEQATACSFGSMRSQMRLRPQIWPPFIFPAGTIKAVTLNARIAAAAEKIRSTGRHPHEVHLTKTDAAKLQYELLAEGGNVAAAIMRDGLQKAVRSILG